MHRNPKEPEFMKIPPTTIREFRIMLPTETIAMPELVRQRYCTDLLFLLVFVVYMAGMIAWCVYVCWNEHLPTKIHGADNCGNICGTNNTNIRSKDEDCKLEDYSDKPILLYVSTTTYVCISRDECRLPDRELILRRCFPNDPKNLSEELQDAAHYHRGYQTMYNYRYIYVAMLTVTLVLCLFTYMILCINKMRIRVGLAVCSVALLTIFSMVSWFFFLSTHDLRYIVSSCLSLILLGALIVLFLFLSDRFTLVLRIQTEAIKAVLKSPILLAQPFFTIVFVFGLNAVVVLLNIMLKIPIGYESVRPMTLVFMFFTLYWLYGVANGCQCMITAGVVCAHYFKREQSPPPRFSWLKASWVTLRYHLGTVCVGALVVVLMRGLKPVFGCARKSKFCFAFTRPCFEKLREISEYWTKRAYITTAIHGKGIRTSGRRAARLSWFFFCDFITVPALAAACLHAMSFFTVITAVMVTVVVNSTSTRHIGSTENEIEALLYGAYFCGIISYFYCSLICVTIQTLVVCFCEDRLLNDGSRYQPYFMSAQLYTIMIKSLELEYREQYISEEQQSVY